jgi:hypothetical protein
MRLNQLKHEVSGGARPDLKSNAPMLCFVGPNEANSRKTISAMCSETKG